MAHADAENDGWDLAQAGPVDYLMVEFRATR
jgi:hypothetical protein